ncbi:hypothetical protein J6590_029174 [Homalodisca vitripennis]|nr:hypothetical protein J6590_029174 [Homalodisca vitripennis]
MLISAFPRPRGKDTSEKDRNENEISGLNDEYQESTDPRPAVGRDCQRCLAAIYCSIRQPPAITIFISPQNVTPCFLREPATRNVFRTIKSRNENDRLVRALPCRRR